jgi:uncharacterized alkaline shock family protein YloU
MGEQRTQDEQRQQESPLRTERGSTTIQDGVVYKISGMAAEEVDGVRGWASAAEEARAEASRRRWVRSRAQSI